MIKLNKLNENIKNKKVTRRQLLEVIDCTYKIKYKNINRVPAMIWREIPKFNDFPNIKSFESYNNFMLTENRDKISFTTIRNNIDNFYGNVGIFFNRIHNMFQNCRDFNNSIEDKPLRDLSIRLENDIIKIIEDKFKDNKKAKLKIITNKKNLKRDINNISTKNKNNKNSVMNHVLFQNSPINVMTIDGFDFSESNVPHKFREVSEYQNINKSKKRKITKLGSGKKTGILMKLKKLIKLSVQINNNNYDDDIKNRFNEYLLKNNYDLKLLQYKYNSKDDDKIIEVDKDITNIDNYLKFLIKDNKENKLIKKEVTNVLNNIISTLTYPERFKKIQEIRRINNNIKGNNLVIHNLNKKYDTVKKKKEQMEEELYNLRLNTGRIRNEIFKLNDEINKEYTISKKVEKTHSDYLNLVKKLSKENLELQQTIKLYNKEKNINLDLTKKHGNKRKKLECLRKKNKIIENKNIKLKKSHDIQKKNHDKMNCQNEKLMRNITMYQKKSNILTKNIETNKSKFDELKKLYDKDYENFQKNYNLMTAFSNFRNNQKIILDKLDDFNEYVRRKNINHHNSTSDLEIINSMNISENCKFCGKNYKESDFLGLCVAFPCGHTGICLSCVNRNYKNKIKGANGKCYDKCFMKNCCSKKCHYTKIVL